MATTVYTPWSTKAYVSSTATRQYRGWLSYNVSTTDTKVTVTAWSGIQQSAAMSVAYTDTQTATGGYSKTGTVSFSYSTGEVNKQAVATQTYTFNRGTAAVTRNIRIDVHATNASSASGWNNTTLYKQVGISVPALASWVVSYNANGGSGSVANGTKYYGTNLTLSDGAGFTRTGYTLTEWNTQPDGSGTTYSKGQTYSDNAALTLYAIWTANTYTVTYDKNNSSATGSTADSTHTYDVAKNLTANGYSLTDYLFEGWAVSSTGAVTYTDSQSVKNLAPSGTFTLYAKWKYAFESPDIQTTSAIRWNVTEGTADDAGDAGQITTYVTPAYKYSSLTTKSYVSTQVKAEYRISGSTGAYTQLGSVQTINAPSSLTWTSNASTFDLTQQYDVVITASVIESGTTKISSSNSTFISIAEFIVDFDGAGESLGIFHIADGATAEGKKAIRLEGDIVLYLDDTAASGTDYEILQALSDLGWDVDAD